MKRAGVLVSLVVSAVLAKAQTALPSHASAAGQRLEAAKAEVTEHWRSFQARLSSDPNKSAEERIRMVDEWIAERKSDLEKVHQAERQLARIAATHPPAQAAQAAPIPVETDPLLADIRATDAEVATAMRDMRRRKVSPAEHIQNIDQFLALNREALAERDTKQAQRSRRQAGTKAPSLPRPLSNDPDPRVRKVTDGIHGLMKSARTMAPHETISALDTKREALQRIESEPKPVAPKNNRLPSPNH